MKDGDYLMRVMNSRGMTESRAERPWRERERRREGTGDREERIELEGPVEAT